MWTWFWLNYFTVGDVVCYSNFPHSALKKHDYVEDLVIVGFLYIFFYYFVPFFTYTTTLKIKKEKITGSYIFLTSSLFTSQARESK